MPDSKLISNQLLEFYKKPYTVVSLELILTVGLALFLVTIIIRPTLQIMSGLSKEIAEKKELSQQLEKKSAALATAQAVYFSSRDQLSLLDEAIPSHDSLITDLKTIERMASDNAVIISSIGVQGERLKVINDSTPSGEVNQISSSSKNPSDRLPLSISVEGDYLSIKNFVDQLISYRRLFIIQSISFSIKKQQTDQALSASLILETPYSTQ